MSRFQARKRRPTSYIPINVQKKWAAGKDFSHQRVYSHVFKVFMSVISVEMVLLENNILVVSLITVTNEKDITKTSFAESESISYRVKNSNRINKNTTHPSKFIFPSVIKSNKSSSCIELQSIGFLRCHAFRRHVFSSWILSSSHAHSGLR